MVRLKASARSIRATEEKPMKVRPSRWFARTLRIAAVFGLAACSASVTAGKLPDPAVDASPPKSAAAMQTAVFAGGCFWGVEAVFESLKGVKQAVSGYSGDSKETADYDKVSTGRTRHAEAVQVTFDPAQISYGKLLQVFFQVAHDPTELNRQGPDVGPQYRSAIFYASPEQKRVADAYIAQLAAAKSFPRKIVTEVTPLKAFYEAEAYHQDYLKRNPTQPYIVFHDLPKLAALQREFATLVRN
jgi:peptide-methionine (S)-S-oxide reductase